MSIKPNPVFEVRRMHLDEVAIVSNLHFQFFGVGKTHGHSLARMGPEFLEQVFYRMNLDNPYFFADVALYQGEIIAFCVYITNRHKAFRYTVQKHALTLFWSIIRYISHKPHSLLHLLSNLRYVGGEKMAWLKEANGHLLLLAVKPDYRSKIFKQKTDIWVALELCKSMEQVMKQHGCKSWYTALSIYNQPINLFAQKFGARLVGTANAQGGNLNYWSKKIL